MGIFKKLFGDSTDKSSNDINSTVKGSYEQQTTNSISQSTHAPNMTSWENFFGVNLKSSPNELWKEGELQYTEKDVIRNFTNNHVDNDYFSSVNAKVIGNSATNFFFKCPYTWDDAFDIYFLIERDFVHNGNYTNTAAAAKFRGKFDSYYDSFSWDIDGCSITMSRDINNGDIELGVWTLFYNHEYLDKTKERSETYEQKEDETTLPKKKFMSIYWGGLDTLHFVHDHLGKQLAGTASCYVARAEGTTIHLLDENDFNEVYSFESKEIADYLGNRLGAAGFIKFNCDDVTDIQAELFIIPAEDTKETSDTESEDALVHYEMSYLVDPVEIDYRRKTIMDGSMNLNIVGFQYRDNYEELKHSIKEGMSVILKPELTNEYDPNALAFYLEGNVIGYLPKKDQPFAHIFMAKGQIDATICRIDEKWIDTEVYIKKDMIDVNAFKNSGVSLTKIKSFKGGNSSSQSVDFSEFIETL